MKSAKEAREESERKAAAQVKLASLMSGAATAQRTSKLCALR